MAESIPITPGSPNALDRQAREGIALFVVALGRLADSNIAFRSGRSDAWEKREGTYETCAAGHVPKAGVTYDFSVQRVRHEAEVTLEDDPDMADSDDIFARYREVRGPEPEPTLIFTLGTTIVSTNVELPAVLYDEALVEGRYSGPRVANCTLEQTLSMEVHTDGYISGDKENIYTGPDDSVVTSEQEFHFKTEASHLKLIVAPDDDEDKTGLGMSERDFCELLGQPTQTIGRITDISVAGEVISVAAAGLEIVRAITEIIKGQSAGL